MADPNSLFIITTFVFGGLTLILALAVVLMWVFMKPEGRFFLKRTLDPGSLDSIRHEPLSNQLVLDTIKWNGETFHSDKGIYYPLSQILNPKNAAQAIYNQVISTAARWKGSKRPVIFTTDLMSFAVPAGFYAAIEKAKQVEKYTEIKPLLKQLGELLKDENIEYFSFIETFNIADIQEILKDVGPKKIRDSYKKGVHAEKLKNVKLGEGMLSQIPLWLIMIGLLVVIGGAIYLLMQSGYINL